MEYKPSNSGILNPSMLKTGDRLIILEAAYQTFVEAKQATYWNVKVQLPDGSQKLTGLFESACDLFAAKWGNKTEQWVGHAVEVEIRTSQAGNPYIVMSPTDASVVTVTVTTPAPKPVATAEKPIEYPQEDINPNDIPF